MRKVSLTCLSLVPFAKWGSVTWAPESIQSGQMIVPCSFHETPESELILGYGPDRSSNVSRAEYERRKRRHYQWMSLFVGCGCPAMNAVLPSEVLFILVIVHFMSPLHTLLEYSHPSAFPGCGFASVALFTHPASRYLCNNSDAHCGHLRI